MRKGIVYGYYQPASGKWYVGQTVFENKRKVEHRNCHKKNKFTSAIKKYGFDSFEYVVFFRVEGEDDVVKKALDEMEIYYIKEKDSYNNGYNLTLGGGGCLGMKLSDEAKEKMSISRKGKKFSDEYKKKLSVINTGKKLSEETKEKMRRFRLGRKESPESTEKRVEKLYKTVLQYSKEGVFIREYKSLKMAGQENNIDPKRISECCRGNLKTSGGFVWKIKAKEDSV